MKLKKIKQSICVVLSAFMLSGSLPAYAAGESSSSAITETASSVGETYTENQNVADSSVSSDITENTGTENESSSSESQTISGSDPEQVSEADSQTETQSTVQSDAQTEEIKAQSEEESDTPEAVITVKENGSAVAEAKNFAIPSDVQETVVAVWSDADGQDDLKWYKLTGSLDDLKAELNLHDHAEKDGLFFFHFYYKTADGKMVCFKQQTLTTTDVFNTKVEAEETADGFKLTLANPTKTPSRVEFAVWSDENGQDDLQWLKASYNAATGTAVYNWDLSGLKHFGKVLIHCYVKDSAGKMILQGTTSVEIGEPSIGSVTADFDPSTGNYEVIISDITNPASISKMVVPTWCDSKQADLIWQPAVKQADGTWKVTANISSHAYRSGEYQAHVYVTNKLGKESYAGKTTFNVSASDIRTKTEEKVSDTGICEIRAVNYNELENAKNVCVAFWSDESGQDDLKWYRLSRKEESSGTATDVVWYADIDLKNHGAVNGIYYAHIYYTNSSGKQICLSPYSFSVSDLFNTTLTAEEKNGVYSILLSNPTVTPSKVSFAIWSEENGQDDLKWYDVSFNSTRREASLSWNGDSLKHNGTVHIHAYAVDKNGRMVFQEKTDVEVTAPAVSDLQTSFTKSSGKYQVTASKVTGSIKSMVAAVWADAKQTDLKWIPLTESSSGTWTCTGNISNHGYRCGTYNVHLYVTDTKGVQTCAAQATFTSELAGKISVSAVHENNLYRATVSELYSDTVSVSVAVWSEENGQDDLKWYTAVKSGNQYIADIPVSNHKTLGTYYAHVYVKRSDGVNYNTEDLRGTFSVTNSASGEFSYIDRQTDNGTFVVSTPVYSYLDVSTVNFTVWTEKNGTDDQETIAAEQAEDGTWGVVVNPANHLYESGVYKILCEATLEDGTVCTVGEDSYTVSTDTVFYTVVASETQAACIVQGYTDASQVTVKVWSVNGGQDDLKEYTAEKTENGWKAVILKANHGSAGNYKAELYVEGTLLATDQFSFDAGRLADSWYSIASAHAAGGQGTDHSETYTNSVQAMNASYDAGYRTFEIDVLLTSDGQPVLFHTWYTGILDHFIYSSSTQDGPTYQQFMNDTMYGGKYKTSDYKDLLTYLTQHPDVKIILDTKYRTASEMQTLYSKLMSVASGMNAVSVMKNQIIPYIFYTDELSVIRQICSFKEYHYATYAAYPQKIGTFSTSEFRTLLQYCKMNKILSISMWDSLATAELIRMADSYGIDVYVHTTDDAATAERLLKLGAAGIITNSISPVQAIGFID